MDDPRDEQVEEDRTPCNIEAEAGLLGAIMLDNRLLDSLARLQPEHFYEPLHGEIYDAMRSLAAKNMVATPVTLKPFFEHNERMKQVGGWGYLAELTGSGATLIAAIDFARQVLAMHELRQMREAVYETLNAIEDPRADIEPKELAADLESKVNGALLEPAVKSTVTFADALKDAADEIEAIHQGAKPPGFLISRLNDWNRVVGRMEAGDFILLGARPSMGKTAVGVTVAIGAGEAGVGTDFLSLEMDRRKATRRAMAEVIFDPDDPLPYQQLIDGKLQMRHWRAVADARDKLQDIPLTISDPNYMAVEDVAPHIRKRQREFERRGQKLELVVLDYIGRLGARKKMSGGETEIVSYISRILKATAKECGVVLIALSQLSRAVEARENKRPMLADLRQSGSLEQDADTVVFLYRDEYYHERLEPPKNTEKWTKWKDELDLVRDDIEIYTAKRREGALTKRTAKFYTNYQAIVDHDDPRLTHAPRFFDDDFPEQRG